MYYEIWHAIWYIAIGSRTSELSVRARDRP